MRLMTISLPPLARATWVLAGLFGLPPESLTSIDAPRVVWSQGRVIEARRDGFDVLSSGPEQRTHVALPMAARWTAVGPDGSLWALGEAAQEAASDPSAKPMRTQSIWRCQDLKTWQLWAKWEIPQDQILVALVPLEQDRIYACSNGILWEDPGSDRNDTQGVFSRSGDRLRLDHLVQLDLGGDPYLPSHGDPKGLGIQRRGKSYSYNRLRHLWVMAFADFEHPDAPIALWQVGNGFCVVNRFFGLVWCFNSHGELVRRVKLFDQGDDATLSRFSAHFEYGAAVLGCQPAQDGTLLLASRSRESVFGSRALYPQKRPDGELVPHERFMASEHWSQLQFPEVWWWRVKPDTGEASRIDAPPGAPLNVDDHIRKAGLTWSCLTNGDLVFPKVQEPRTPSAK